MRKDGELHAEDDRNRKAELEARNEADSAVYRTERLLKDNADKISAENQAKLEAAASAVKEALKGSEVAAIKTASENLNATWQAVSTELYKTAGEPDPAGKDSTGGQPGQPPEAEHNPDDRKQEEEPVIDAEVVNDR